MSDFDKFAATLVTSIENAESFEERAVIASALSSVLGDKVGEYQEWSAKVMSVMLGWAMYFVEEALGEDAKPEEVLEAYPMKTFRELYDRGAELGLLEKRRGDEDAGTVAGA